MLQHRQLPICSLSQGNLAQQMYLAEATLLNHKGLQHQAGFCTLHTPSTVQEEGRVAYSLAGGMWAINISKQIRQHSRSARHGLPLSLTAQ
jgi:hypothetical protein